MQGRPAPERQMDIFGYHLRYKQKTKKPTGATKGRKESRDIQEKPKQKQECGQTGNNTNKITVVVVTNAGFRHVDRTELSYFTLWTTASIPGLFLLL